MALPHCFVPKRLYDAKLGNKITVNYFYRKYVFEFSLVMFNFVNYKKVLVSVVFESAFHGSRGKLYFSNNMTLNAVFVLVKAWLMLKHFTRYAIARAVFLHLFVVV